MNTKWLISDHVKDKKFEMNISNYSSLFINESTNFYDLIMKLHEYFKPRTKMRDYITIKESTNDFEEISNHAYYSFIISESILEDEKQLKNKSLLKDHIKNKLLNNLETNGYLLTVNTL